jgi:acyl-CoA dehydrogenase
MTPGELRDSITGGIYIPEDPEEAVGRYEHAFKLVTEANAIYHKIFKAVKSKKLPKGKPFKLLDKALEAGVISAAEHETVKAAEAARDDAVEVDSFDLKDFTTAILTSHEPAASKSSKQKEVQRPKVVTGS